MSDYDEADEMSHEDEAATIIADLLPGPLIRRMDETGDVATPLYGWEQRAINWLRSYRARGGDVPLNMWTMSYVSYGPPPWSKTMPKQAKKALGYE